MKLTNVKRILIEDFPAEQRETVSKLALIINGVFNQLNQILVNNLTITDNLNQNLTSITVEVDSNGIPLTRTEFKHTLKGNCQGLVVINATNTTTAGSFPVSHPFISFSQTTGLITVLNVTGLQANNKYTLTVLVLGN